MPEQRKVEPGDHLTGIAEKLGLPDTQTILLQSANADFRDRPHPEMLNPGETLSLPDLEPLKYTLATGKRHKLTIPRPKAKLCVAFTTFQGKPTAASQVELRLNGKAPEAISLSDGVLEEPISPTCPLAEVKMPASAEGKPEVHWRLRLGHMVRSEGDEGAFARLRNLGYYRVVPKAADARERRSAIEEFQFVQGLTVSGTLDDATRATIEDLYGC
jgi:hypothetical protein